LHLGKAIHEQCFPAIGSGSRIRYNREATCHLATLRIRLGSVKISKPEPVTGVLEYDPELRFTPGGYPVSTFVLIDHASGEKIYCEMWREKAEDFIEAFFSGQRMTTMRVWGVFRMNTWFDRNGEEQSRRVFTVRRYEFPSE
jgi:hypothetical protein